MDLDDMDHDDWLDWIQNPPRPETPPLSDDEAFAEFERADEIASKIMATEEFITGEVVLISCPICRTPCKAEGGHGLSFRHKEGKECPICENNAGEEDIIRVKLFSAGEKEDLSGALANLC